MSTDLAHNERAPLAPQTSPVMALMQLAIEKGPEAAAAMETLYKLHVAERDHAARRSYFAAVSRFHAECPTIQRTSSGPVLRGSGTKVAFNYADFEEIATTIRPHLLKNGLSYSHDTDASDGKVATIACHLTHEDGHTEKSRMTLPLAAASPAMTPQQAVAAAFTFGRRHTLIAVLGLAMGDPDPDGAADPTTITEDQAMDLIALADERKVSMTRVLKYAGVERVEDIRAADYVRVVEGTRNAKPDPGVAR